MPALANAKYEAFAQAVAAGCSLTEASKRSGHLHGANNFGARLMQRDEVSQRVHELKAIPAGQEPIPGSDHPSVIPSQDVLAYTSKPYVTVQLVEIHQLARKARDYGVSHAVLRTLAQLGGHLDGNRGVSDPRDPARLALMGIKEIHSMLTQVVGSVPRTERTKLLAEAPELRELVGDVEEPAEEAPSVIEQK